MLLLTLLAFSRVLVGEPRQKRELFVIFEVGKSSREHKQANSPPGPSRTMLETDSVMNRNIIFITLHELHGN